MKSNFFEQYRVPVIFGMVLILVCGVFAFRQIQVSLFPEITFPKIKIIADNGEQPVDQMLITVTKPLEEAVKLVPDLKDVRSVTSRGSCEISAYLDWKADIFTSQQLIESRIAAIRSTLPPGVNITVERMNPSILPIMGFSVESKNKSLLELKLLAQYTIKPYLSQIEGVAEIRVQGGKVKEYWIELIPAKLLQYGLTPGDISRALATTGYIRSTGYMNNYRRLYLTLVDAGMYQPQDIGEIPLTPGMLSPVRVKDVASVHVQEKIEYVKINANGQEGVLVNVVKQPNANLIQVNDEVNQKIKEMAAILPAGVVLKPYYQQADFVTTSISSIQDALLIGLVLAMLVTILFLRSLQASLSILFVIPATLGCTFLALWLMGETLNIMTIGALAAAIGLVIDDAVIVIEQLHRTREEHPETPFLTLIDQSIRKLLPAMIGSSLSTTLIFAPFALMSGVAGAYFKVLAFTMVIALTCSFFISAVVLPAFYGWLSSWIPANIQAVHHVEKRRWVDFLIRKFWISGLFMAGLAAAAYFIIPNLETGFLPEMDEGSIVLDFSSPPGTSIEATDYMLTAVDSIILKTPEVISYSRRTGAQMGFFITEPNRGDYLITLNPVRDRTTEEVISAIRHEVESSQPALVVDFGQVIGDMLGDLMSSVQPIEIKVFGTDKEKLQRYSQQVFDIVENTAGTADVFDGLVIAGPHISLLPKQAELARYGLSVDELQQQVQVAMSGQLAGSVVETQQLTDIRMVNQGVRDFKQENLRNLSILLKGGRSVPLEALATLEPHTGVAEQERENLQPIIAITARLESRDLGSVMTEIQQKIKQEVAFEKGYGVIYGGAFAEQQQSFRDLLTILVLASLLVLLVQLVLFRNLRVAFTILLVAVMGMCGSLIAIWSTGTALNVGSYMGLIMIVGIIAENAIFTYQQFEAALEDHDVDGALNFAIASRLRPKLMTALGAIIALAPLAAGIGTGAKLHQPLAIAVIGGLVVALPLLLVVFPALIRIGHPRQK